jgi:metal-dependent amidase/aminoacylase/carboxypeptidase family protein
VRPYNGHTTILLGATQYFSEAKSFNGTIHFTFQPAEEGGTGAKAMIEDGLSGNLPATQFTVSTICRLSRPVISVFVQAP